jgi:hypothetical protein
MNIVCTSKPCDGLFHYSYEYASILNCPLIVITHPDFTEQDYINTIKFKYNNEIEVIFDDLEPGNTIILGRSMMTLPYLSWNRYTGDQQFVMLQLFKKVLAVYSENHPEQYPKAKEFFKSKTVDIGDTEVYKNFNGIHFEKTINFSVYKPIEPMIKFKYLFMGTNRAYYESAKKAIATGNFNDHGIITYEGEDYLDKNLNNLYAPIENILSLFDTYVYTKETFDPAPRITQECKYLSKNVIYYRDKELRDGGYVYWNRDIKEPSIDPILEGLKLL